MFIILATVIYCARIFCLNAARQRRETTKRSRGLILHGEGKKFLSLKEENNYSRSSQSRRIEHGNTTKTFVVQCKWFVCCRPLLLSYSLSEPTDWPTNQVDSVPRSSQNQRKEWKNRAVACLCIVFFLSFR